MIRDINLLEYLPGYLQQYQELIFITKAEDPEFQLVADESEIIKDNQFILTCDINGIERFEKLLNIYPSSDDTLESRISRVMNRWNDIVPYTFNALIQKLISLSGDDNFIINEDFKNYKIEIITHLELSGQVDELQNLLNYIIPVNLEVTSKNRLICNAQGSANLASGMAFCHVFELSDAYTENFEIQGNNTVKSGIVTTDTIEISDAYTEHFDVQGNANVIGGPINTIEISISDNLNTNVNINGTSNIGSDVVITEIISTH